MKWQTFVGLLLILCMFGFTWWVKGFTGGVYVWEAGSKEKQRI